MITHFPFTLSNGITFNDLASMLRYHDELRFLIESLRSNPYGLNSSPFLVAFLEISDQLNREICNQQYGIFHISDKDFPF